MDLKTRLVTQLVMTCMMALSMSGIMATVILGVGQISVGMWLQQFIIAWPIAFIMTNILFPIAAKITGLVLGKH